MYLPELSLSLAIIKPREIDVSTVAAYKSYRQQGHYEIRSPEKLLHALGNARIATEIEAFLWNDFESVLFEAYPALARYVAQMQTLGISRPLMAGSGPTLVGLIEETPENRRILAEYFPDSDFEVFWACTHPAGMMPVVPVM